MTAARARVRYEKKDHVAHVTLDRPEVLNAMDLRTHEELAGIWDDIEAAGEVRVAVLTGVGERAFSVGQDLKERARLDAAGTPPTTFGSHGLPGWPRLTDRFILSKPMLARVHGYALGEGFELALACDLIVASDQAVFSLPEARLGLIPGAGGVPDGPATAAEGGTGLSADRPPDERGDRAGARPRQRGGSGGGVGPVRGPVDGRPRPQRSAVGPGHQGGGAQKSVDIPLEQAFTTTYVWEERRRRSTDAVEGVQAFVEKHRPVWSGR